MKLSTAPMEMQFTPTIMKSNVDIPSKKPKIYITYDPAVQMVGIYFQKINTVYERDVYIHIFL